MPDSDIIKKVQTIDIKKGDVLLITVSPPYDDLPRHVQNKKIHEEQKAVYNKFKHVFGDKIQIIFIPDTMNVSVIRLEEWFV